MGKLIRVFWTPRTRLKGEGHKHDGNVGRSAHAGMRQDGHAGRPTKRRRGTAPYKQTVWVKFFSTVGCCPLWGVLDSRERKDVLVG